MMKRCCCWGRDGGLGPLLLLLLLGVAAMLPTGDAHSAMTIPQPRNAVDSDEQPWGGKVPHPLPFEPWCPIPSKAAAGKDDRNISGEPRANDPIIPCPLPLPLPLPRAAQLGARRRR